MECFLWSEASKNRNVLTAKYEPLQPFLFLSFLRFANAKSVLDVGANVGLYSMVSSLCESVEEVYAFEPDEAAYPELKKNIEINGLNGVVVAQNSAVSNSEGTVQFGSHSPMSGVNGVVDTSIHDISIFSETRDVQAISLDSFHDLYGKVIALKIDVEGHELKVIEGAKNLLISSPAFIQVEHYVGSGIDESLKELGYFCFFKAGHDYYFSNIVNFKNPDFVKRAAEYASTWLIESSSSRWPSVRSIKDSLKVSAHIENGQVLASAVLEKGFFTEPEFAFYLMVKGSKVQDQWYKSVREAVFEAPVDAESIEIKAFVREKGLPEKKVVVGYFLKQAATGYRAPSSVEEALGMPSEYSSSIGSSHFLNDPKLDLQPLMTTLKTEGGDNVLQLGGGAAAIGIALKFSKSLANVATICTPKKGAALKRWLIHNANNKPNSCVSCIFQAHDAKSLHHSLARFLEKYTTVSHLVISSQFLQEIGLKVEDLSSVLEICTPKLNLYIEALTNESYRNSWLVLANKYKANVQWLYPSSTIVSQVKVRVDSLRSDKHTAENFDFTTCGHAGDAYFFESENAFYPERAVGLDFSLPKRGNRS